MEFEVLESSSIKTFARVFQSASKIGDDIMIASADDEVQMRTLNASHSTCAKFIFRRPFFNRLVLPRSQLDAKVPVRALIPIFRTASSVLDGRLGVTVFDKNRCSCMLQTRARFFLDLLANFHGKLDEITFTPSQNSMRIASFVDDMASTSNRILRTEMTVDAREFEIHRFSKQHDIVLTIFCKYFRAMLEFCDHFECPMQVWYEASGHPLLFSLEIAPPGLDAHFDAEFVFATRHVEEASLASGDAENSTSQPGDKSNGRPTPVASVRHRNRALSVHNRPPTQTTPPPLLTQESQAPASRGSTQNTGRTASPRRTCQLQPAATAAAKAESGPSHVSETPDDGMAIDILEPPVLRTPTRTKVKHLGTTCETPSAALTEQKQSQLIASESHRDSAHEESVPETPNPDRQPSRSQLIGEMSPPVPVGLLAKRRDYSDDDDDEFVEGTPPPN